MIKVYLANRPPLIAFDEVDGLSVLKKGDIEHIVKETGNHWRKIFNVYAKLIFALALKVDCKKVAGFTSWQQYRDELLLQQGSETELLFYPKEQQEREYFMKSFTEIESESLRIIMGKSFSSKVLGAHRLEWVDDDFAYDVKTGVWICPYFDYRQLSNLKIDRFVDLMIEQSNKDTVNYYLSNQLV